ncbi:hypothetical protein [Streptomyces sp. NPDC049879]|uniref:hypothetical protein n=1 Tax=Streptomyces sp. NPDC049879 TaxID=3365598 RepID=UPI00378B0AC0
MTSFPAISWWPTAVTIDGHGRPLPAWTDGTSNRFGISVTFSDDVVQMIADDFEAEKNPYGNRLRRIEEGWELRNLSYDDEYPQVIEPDVYGRYAIGDEWCWAEGGPGTSAELNALLDRHKPRPDTVNSTNRWSVVWGTCQTRLTVAETVPTPLEDGARAELEAACRAEGFEVHHVTARGVVDAEQATRAAYYASRI